jgi:5-methylcytosine-specific restriction enzyme A
VPRASRHEAYDRLARDPDASRFYHSARWRKARLMKLRRQPLCELCLIQGRLVAAALVHHMFELASRPDLALDLDNLQSLCPSCHSRLHATGGGVGAE